MTLHYAFDTQSSADSSSTLPLSDLPTNASATYDEFPYPGLEATLQQLCVEALGIQELLADVDDNFFSLGGDSLIAMKMCAAARARAIPLTVETVLKYPTIRTMTDAVRHSLQRSTTTVTSSMQAIEPFSLLQSYASPGTIRHLAAEQCQVDEASVQDAYPCTPLQQALFLHSLKTPGSYVIQHCWDVPANINIYRFKKAWQTVYDAVDILRTRFIDGSDTALWQIVLRDNMQWNSSPSAFGADDDDCMDLGHPLYRFALVSHHDRILGHQLVIQAHHAVMDGWTAQLLLTAFTNAYLGSERLANPPFCQFVRYLQLEPAESHQEFWSAQLAGFTTSKLRLAAPTPAQGRVIRGISRLETPLVSSRKLAYTTSEYLRAAWAFAISAYENANDVILGVVESGRDAPILGVEDIAGPTMATVPVRIRLRPDESIAWLMRSMRAQRVSMIAHRHVGLHSIAQYSPSAEAACDINNVITVQPSFEERNAACPLQHTFADVHVDDFSLLLDCNLGASAVEFVLDHVLAELSEAAAEEMLSNLAFTFQRLQDATSTTRIGDLKMSNRLGTGQKHLPSCPESIHAVHAQQRVVDLTRQTPAVRASATTDATPSMGSVGDQSKAVEFWHNCLASPPDSRSLSSNKASIYFPRLEANVEDKMQLTFPSTTSLPKSTYISAAWVLTMSQYLESEDVIYGAAVGASNSSIDDYISLPGSTVSLIPMRVVVHRNESVQRLLARVQHQLTIPAPFANIPLSRIRDISDDSKSACKFETILCIQLAGEVTSRTSMPVTTTHSLVVGCTLDQSDVFAQIDYDDAMISPWLARKILENFQHMLRRMIECSSSELDTKVGDLELISQADKEDLIRWNADDYHFVDACIHEKLDLQVALSPDKMAVQGWDASFTYQELGNLSTKLAEHLIRLGVGEKPIIPLCFNKSAWTIVAMLATLKAGGAYVPLDASHPPDRLKMLVERTRAGTALVGVEYRTLFDAHVARVIVVGDALRNELLGATAPDDVALPVARPGDAAIICFTSGSTGIPKGVVLQHDAFCTLAASVGAQMRFQSSSRVLQFAGYAFDVCNSEIFLTLLHGGCCCVPSESERVNDLAGVIRRMEINWLFLTPTVASMILPEDIPSVQTLTLGGEAVRQDLIDRFAGRIRMTGAYGPAEGTIWPSITRLRPDSSPTDIGASNRSCHFWLVDANNHDRLVPIGTVGEILLEGPMVARGYLFDEVKTKAAFIDPPKWAVTAPGPANGPPRRFYKVGDLARQQADGSFSFVGRRDTQVKLRGHRIELGEVESRIATSGAKIIAAAAVDVASLNAHSTTLVAFCVPVGDVELRYVNNVGTMTAEMRDQLRGLHDELVKSLPSVMVPSFYLPLQRLPTSLSRKLDRKALRQCFEQLSPAERQQYSLATWGA